MKTGIITGNFDVLHPGYIKMFKEAKSNCDHVIVLLHKDPSVERPSKIKPILSVCERVEMLNSIKYIDEIIEYDLEMDLERLIISICPDIRFLGDDYRGRTDYTGYDIDQKVYYFDRSHGWSTTKYKKLISDSILSKN